MDNKFEKARLNSSLDQQDRIPEYQKSRFTESILDRMNSGLAECEKWLEGELLKNQGHYPVIVLVAAPRSGSTLFTQMGCSRYAVGYPSNLMARFYGAPLIGAFLQTELLGNRMSDIRDYSSEHGVTDAIEEPHEFGYFWMQYLGLEESVHEPAESWQIDPSVFKALEQKLRALTLLFEKPVLMKCSIGAFFLPILERMKNVFIVHLKRNAVDNIASILNTRQKRLGDLTKWWSVRPANYETLSKLDPISQVCHQYNAIENAIERDFGNVPIERKMIIPYEEMISNPEVVFQELMVKVGEFGNLEIAKIGLPLQRSNRNFTKSNATIQLQKRIADTFSSL